MITIIAGCARMKTWMVSMWNWTSWAVPFERWGAGQVFHFQFVARASKPKKKKKELKTNTLSHIKSTIRYGLSDFWGVCSFKNMCVIYPDLFNLFAIANSQDSSGFSTEANRIHTQTGRQLCVCSMSHRVQFSIKGSPYYCYKVLFE